MSAPRIPFQSLESNRNTTTASETSAYNLKLLNNLKRKLPTLVNRKGSMNSSNGSENQQDSKNTNPIKAPATTTSTANKRSKTTQLNVHKYPVIESRKVKSFTVFKDTPLETEETTLKELPEARIRNRGYAKYKNKLSVVADDTHQKGLNLFKDSDTPIRKLPYDCLVEIFLRCSHTETLLELSRVCHSWRKIALQPSVWKEVTCNWSSLARQLSNSMQMSRSNRYLKHCQHLTVTALCDTSLSKSNYFRSTSPFKQLNTLHLSSVRMSDIEYITSWMTRLNTLQCIHIPVDTNGCVFVPNLTHLYQLTTLQLRFARPCSLKLTYFISAPDLKRLPSSLTHLTITDIRDREENELSHQEVADAASFITERTTDWNNALSPNEILTAWTKLEEQLVLKYTMLTFLTNLTSLSLHSVGSFTSKVWRECLIPCSTNLRHVSFSGWSDDRESPQAMVSRVFAYRRRRQAHLKMSDVDLAVSEFFSSLAQIESISLHDFMCTEGLVKGIIALDKNYSIRDWPDTTDITVFLDRPLDDFYMTLSNKSTQQD